VDNKLFQESIESVKKTLVNLEMDRTFNSTGSNVFFEFGKAKEIASKSGKVRIKKDWSIWIGDASWRITKKDKYVVGSDDSRELIHSNIQKLLGKRFQSLQFTSQFLDVEFNFEDEYKLKTFYNWPGDNQWRIYLPNETDIGIDCSTPEERKNIQILAKHFTIPDKYTPLSIAQLNEVLLNIDQDQPTQPTFHFANNTSIEFLQCLWRLEKDSNYIIGSLDENLSHDTSLLSKIVGKKLLKIGVANSMMDAIFEFEDHYTLKTFTCSRHNPQWTAGSEFSANIELD
jgi:hypothetical protein